MANWNPWHGCVKYSAGCLNCYVYRGDGRYGRDSSQVSKNSGFYAPIAKNRQGGYKIPSGETVWTCFTSDFFLDLADDWRPECWEMMRLRQDLHFLFITKRIERFYDCIPPDWGGGYANVTICCTCENQAMAERRLPVFTAAPIVRRHIVCEPLLGPMDISKWLTPEIAGVTVGGESGPEARPCRFEWITAIRAQCVAAGVPFHFKQTGANFYKNGLHYAVPRALQHSQAAKADIEFKLGEKSHEQQRTGNSGD